MRDLNASTSTARVSGSRRGILDAQSPTATPTVEHPYSSRRPRYGPGVSLYEISNILPKSPPTCTTTATTTMLIPCAGRLVGYSRLGAWFLPPLPPPPYRAP